MSRSLPVPPPGFDKLPTDEKVRYVEALWERMADVRVGPSAEADVRDAALWYEEEKIKTTKSRRARRADRF